MNEICKSYRKLKGGDLVTFLIGWNATIKVGILIDFTIDHKWDKIIAAKIQEINRNYITYIRLRNSGKRVWKMYEQDLLYESDLITIKHIRKKYAKQIKAYNATLPVIVKEKKAKKEKSNSEINEERLFNE
jgi:hypothetical protein